MVCERLLTSVNLSALICDIVNAEVFCFPPVVATPSSFGSFFVMILINCWKQKRFKVKSKCTQNTRHQTRKCQIKTWNALNECVRPYERDLGSLKFIDKINSL